MTWQSSTFVVVVVLLLVLVVMKVGEGGGNVRRCRAQHACGETYW
jgi:hypothetical protein